MTAEEINLIAFNGDEMPAHLNTAEQLLYLKLLYLYKLRSLGRVDTAKGKQMKKQFVKQFESDLFNYQCQMETTDMRNRLSHHLIEITKSGCPLCKRAVEIFDGRYRGLAEKEGEK
jgi:hypothetical protein